jgi:hypothetical protein
MGDIKFYGNNFDSTQYKGFDTVSETQDLCNGFGVNIAYYSYNEEKNLYKQESLIQAEQETTTLVSILLHTGTTLKGINAVPAIINHVMVITNVEKLTGLRF